MSPEGFMLSAMEDAIPIEIESKIFFCELEFKSHDSCGSMISAIRTVAPFD